MVRRGVSGLEERYAVDELRGPLGQGSFSVVRAASCSLTGAWRAVKIIAKDVKNPPDFKNEIALLSSLRHENIVRLFDTFEDEQRFFLVLELCSGGELFDRITELGSLSERAAAVLSRQIAAAVDYLHGEGVVHRDLKPDNFVFVSKGHLESTPIKLIDFGLSRRFEVGEVLTTAVGTLLYAAPEVFSQAYGPSCDLWSFGVIVFTTLSGTPPFDGKSAKQVAKNVRKGRFSFEGACWERVSESAKDLIRGLLTKDTCARLSIAQVLEHPWIDGTKEEAAIAVEPLLEAVQNLQALCEESSRAKSIQRRSMEPELHETLFGEEQKAVRAA